MRRASPGRGELCGSDPGAADRCAIGWSPDQPRCGAASVAGSKWMSLLKRVRDVKQQEFTEFYRSDQAACLRAVLVSVGDRQLAEDLVAEAFTRAWTSWHKVSRHPAPRAWIVRTALNARGSWWRRRRREVAWDGTHEVEDVAAGDSGLDPALLTALRQLSQRQREV